MRALKDKGYLQSIRRILVPGPHGVYSSAFAELYGFSRKRWKRTFEDAGYDLEHSGGSGLFYTGYGLVPRLGVRNRLLVAKFLGSSCHVFVMRPQKI
jgi:hypothetical protein